jgi:hypothetical protein
MSRPGLHIQLRKINDVAGSRSMLKRPYYFQTPPLEEFSHEHGHERTTYMTIGRGEFSKRIGRRLITCQFRTVIVEWGRFVVRPDYRVEKLTDELIEIAEKGYPFRMLATNSYADRPELDIEAVLLSCTPTETAGESDARYFDLSFQEWRDASVGTHSNKKRPGGKNFPFTVTLRRNGTWDWHSHYSYAKPKKGAQLTFELIARMAYGSPSRARIIAERNGMRKWGLHTPIIKSAKYKKGGKIVVPAPPKASINMPK